MSRRTATLAVTGVLVLALSVLAWLMPVPYVVEGPGPTVNTLGTSKGQPLISISGHATYPASGHLNLVTVSVTGGPGDPMNLVTALAAWVNPHEAVVPEEEIFPPGQSSQQVTQQNAEDMKLSQDSATTAALKELGIPVGSSVVVKSIVQGAPALGTLKAGDVLVSIGGAPVTNPDEARAAITKVKAGSSVAMTVKRNGSTVDLTVPTGKDPTDGHTVVGILLDTLYTYPFTVTIKVDDIGGPSAGMMFALGIIDKLTPGDLTGGKFVAGTGEIDVNGNVGVIGGIAQKMIGARSAGAQYFLVPKGNCREALATVPKGLTLVMVSTLHQAVQAVDTIRTGQGTLTPCSPAF